MQASSEIRVDSYVWAQVTEFAVQQNVPPETLANEVLIAGLDALRERLFWQEARGGSAEDGLRILRSAGTEPPIPGDELPEGYEPTFQASIAPE